MALSVAVAAAFLLGVAHANGASQRVVLLLLAVLLTALAQALWHVR